MGGGKGRDTHRLQEGRKEGRNKKERGKRRVRAVLFPVLRVRSTLLLLLLLSHLTAAACGSRGSLVAAAVGRMSIFECAAQAEQWQCRAAAPRESKIIGNPARARLTEGEEKERRCAARAGTTVCAARTTDGRGRETGDRRGGGEGGERREMKRDGTVGRSLRLYDS